MPLAAAEAVAMHLTDNLRSCNRGHGALRGIRTEGLICHWRQRLYVEFEQGAGTAIESLQLYVDTNPGLIEVQIARPTRPRPRPGFEFCLELVRVGSRFRTF